MRTIRRITWIVLCAGLIASTRHSQGNALDAWILEKIENDEQQLQWALRGENGYDVELLPSAKWYKPFFLENPASIDNVGERQLNSLRDYFERENGSGFLAGGYLLRIRFKGNSMLYRMSGGTWGDGSWYSPSLGKEIEIDPLEVWAGGAGSGFSYATILSGVPPRLVVFDEDGKLKDERSFDLSDSNLSSRIDEAKAMYSSSGEPTLEMVSLAEYLREDEPSWRNVDISSSFNLRNQQDRPGEMGRISGIETLSRAEAKSELRLRTRESVPPAERSRGVGDEADNDRPRGDKKSVQSDPAAKREESEAATWPLVLGAIAALAVGIIIIRLFLRGRAS